MTTIIQEPSTITAKVQPHLTTSTKHFQNPSKTIRRETINSKPKIKDMIYLESVHEQDGIRIVEQVTLYCKNLGYTLQLRDKLVRNIWSTPPIHDRCRRTIEQWLDGQGFNHPNSPRYQPAHQPDQPLHNHLDFLSAQKPVTQNQHSLTDQQPVLQDQSNEVFEKYDRVISSIEEPHSLIGFEWCPNIVIWLGLTGINESDQCPIGQEQSLGIAKLARVPPLPNTRHFRDHSMTARSLTMDSKPKFTDMIYLKSVDGREGIRILEEVFQYCKKLGHLLHLRDTVMYNIWNTPPFRDCCERTIGKWLEGQGHGPVTWKTFINAIDGLNLELSDKLRQEFHQLTTSYIPDHSTHQLSTLHNQRGRLVAQHPRLHDQQHSTIDQPVYLDDQSCPVVNHEYFLHNITYSVPLHDQLCPSIGQSSMTTGLQQLSKTTWLGQIPTVVNDLQSSDTSSGLEQCPISNTTGIEQYPINLTSASEQQYNTTTGSKWYLEITSEEHFSTTTKFKRYSKKSWLELRRSITTRSQLYPTTKNKLVQGSSIVSSQVLYSTIHFVEIFYQHSVYGSNSNCKLEHITQYCKMLNHLLSFRDHVMDNIWITGLPSRVKMIWKGIKGQEPIMAILEIFITTLDKLQIRKLFNELCRGCNQPDSSNDQVGVPNKEPLYGQSGSSATQQAGSHNHLGLSKDQPPSLNDTELFSSTNQLSSLHDQSYSLTQKPCSSDECQPSSSSNPLSTLHNQSSTDKLVKFHGKHPSIHTDHVSSSPDHLNHSTDQQLSLSTSKSSNILINPSIVHDQEISSTDRMSNLYGQPDPLANLQTTSLNQDHSTDRVTTSNEGSGMDVWNALMIAIQKGHSDIVKLLLENGAQVNLQDNNGICALMSASQKGHSDIVKLLLEYSAHVNVQDDDGLSALMTASQNGHSQVAKILLENSAQVDMQDKSGRCALMDASQNGHSEVVELLTMNGAKLDLQDDIRRSALMMASQNGHCDVIKILLDHGGQVDLQDRNGMTALMNASQNGHAKVVQTLLDYGAQVHLQRKDGWSALMISSQNGRSEVVEILLKMMSMNMTPDNMRKHTKQ